ncbi:MAG: hypothetical protein EKK32_28955 [Bradyrhizobiaceae bacterium]|uniref:Uncharacterized protein n=1 Tax=Bradyrhizobium denitrificans TaxID=2734912 RepID=A0ABS5G6B9_9BRAD|nr:hypothetical protein [Bradyrhizobium denitrificans]NPU23422.1 hypothetical protein [Bradyrhizobium sp. LMG 8443]RTL93462.1 MAG: hypothetical protein EKK32_28955 [Bradyrhizobiaceae bacterium]
MPQHRMLFAAPDRAFRSWTREC